ARHRHTVHHARLAGGRADLRRGGGDAARPHRRARHCRKRAGPPGARLYAGAYRSGAWQKLGLCQFQGTRDELSVAHAKETTMPSLPRLEESADELTAIRRDLHEHPEIGFEETRTAGIVAEKLRSWGIEVHTGIGKTG